MKKPKVEIIRDETIQATGDDQEIVTIDIKCEKGDVDEHKQRKSIVCLTLSEDEKGLEGIVAGQFSPNNLMAYINGLDSLKTQMLKKLAGMMHDGLGNIIKKLEEEDK